MLVHCLNLCFRLEEGWSRDEMGIAVTVHYMVIKSCTVDTVTDGYRPTYTHTYEINYSWRETPLTLSPLLIKLICPKHEQYNFSETIIITIVTRGVWRVGHDYTRIMIAHTGNLFPSLVRVVQSIGRLSILSVAVLSGYMVKLNKWFITGDNVNPITIYATFRTVAERNSLVTTGPGAVCFVHNLTRECLYSWVRIAVL